jgi:hypothetical protein
VIPQLSQETLAEIVGTTRPRVSSFMNKFRKLGFIGYNVVWKFTVHCSTSSFTIDRLASARSDYRYLVF